MYILEKKNISVNFQILYLVSERIKENKKGYTGNVTKLRKLQ